MMSEREPGFYWVRYRPNWPWEPVEFTRSGAWKFIGDSDAMPAHHIAEIGPRIEPPE